MKKISLTTADDVKSSVSSLYSAMLAKRQQEKDQGEQEAAQRKEERKKKYTKEDGTPMTKKERRQRAYDNWKDIVVELTGDDLEYTSKKKGKKKNQVE